MASDVDFGRAAETEQLIKNAGYDGVAAVADVTDEKAMAAVVEDIVEIEYEEHHPGHHHHAPHDRAGHDRSDSANSGG